MALHDTIPVSRTTPTAISSGAINGPVRIQNQGERKVRVNATSTSATPAAEGFEAGSIVVEAGQATLLRTADHFGGVPGGALHLWGLAEDRLVRVSVSHA